MYYHVGVKVMIGALAGGYINGDDYSEYYSNFVLVCNIYILVVVMCCYNETTLPHFHSACTATCPRRSEMPLWKNSVPEVQEFLSPQMFGEEGWMYNR